MKLDCWQPQVFINIDIAWNGPTGMMFVRSLQLPGAVPDAENGMALIHHLYINKLK